MSYIFKLKAVIMIYIVSVIFIIICLASLTGNNRDEIHHDSRTGSYYEISHRKDD